MVGDTLSPQCNGYCFWPENAVMEEALESRRPKHCIPRKESVFLTGTRCNGEQYGAESAIFELTISSSESTLEQRSDLQWLYPLDQEFTSKQELYDAFDEDTLNELIDGYWSGKPYNNTPKYEYRTHRATVVSIAQTNHR